MPNFRNKVVYAKERALSFLKRSWRNLVAICITFLCVVTGLWSGWQAITTPFNGATMVYVILIAGCALVFSHSSGEAKLDFLFVKEDEDL